jgi:phosphatidate cytidylyltransferase
LLIHLLLYDVIENTVESASQMVLALGYVVVPLCHAILMRRLDMGITLVLFTLIVVCLGDTGAYFTGKYLGKHSLAPKVSPSKTVEGLGGVLAGGLVGMVLMKTIAPYLPGYEVLLPLTLVLVVAGPVGDLIASALKRRLKIKDFGSAIRGHGGLMDRADSLIVAFPTGYYFLILTGYFVPK